MSKAEDINTLYKRFGGNAGTYQEIGANEMVGAATQRWPLLGELRPQGHREAPAATRGGVAVGDRQVRSFLVPPVQRSVPVDPPVEQFVAQVQSVETPTNVAPAPAQTVSAASPDDRTPVKSRQSESVQQQVSEPSVAPPAPRAMFSRARDAEPTRSSRSAPAAASRVPAQEEAVAKPVSRSRKAKETVSEPVAAPLKKTVVKKAPVKTKKRDAEPEDSSSLQSVFNRLVPPKPEAPAAAPAAAPLKKLVKW